MKQSGKKKVKKTAKKGAKGSSARSVKKTGKRRAPKAAKRISMQPAKEPVAPAVRDSCFMCSKPIVRATDEEMRKQYAGAPITAIVTEHYLTPWGPACRDCLPAVKELWLKYRALMEREKK